MRRRSPSRKFDYLPSGKPHYLATIWRWCMGNGVKGVRLEYWREGVQIWTSVEAVKRFRDKVKRVSENARCKKCDDITKKFPFTTALA